MTDQFDPTQRNQPFADDQETTPRTDGRDEDELQAQDAYSSGTPGSQAATAQVVGGGQSPVGLPGEMLANTDDTGTRPGDSTLADAFGGGRHDQPVEGRRDQPTDPADRSEDEQSLTGRDADADEATLGH
jgi:hypothetical protein